MPTPFPDRVTLAKEAYTGPYNCAQAVAVAFRDISGLTDDQIADHKRNGGGRSPNGYCGALHAALEMLPDDARRQRLTEQFIQTVGSTQCREIRAAKVTPCAACVQNAATLLQENLEGPPTP